MNAPDRRRDRGASPRPRRPTVRERRAQSRWTWGIAALVVGSAGLTAGLTALPAVRFLGYVVGFVAVLAIATLLRVLDNRTPMWFAGLLTTALTVLGASALPGELSLASNGERVEAKVVADRKYYTNVGGSRNDKYEYRLEHHDGTPLKKVNSSDPIPAFKKGKTVTVLVDKRAGAEPRPANDPPKPGTFITILVIGLLGTATCLIIALRHARRTAS